MSTEESARGNGMHHWYHGLWDHQHTSPCGLIASFGSQTARDFAMHHFLDLFDSFRSLMPPYFHMLQMLQLQC